MIVTVTLNPAFDKPLSVDRLQPGGLHRVDVGPIVPSGKGINVSRVLRRWGVATKAVIMAGEGQTALVRSLTAEEIPCRVVPVAGQVRMNIKLFETAFGRMTELNEPGPLVEEADVQQLENALTEECVGARLVVFAGSLPVGAAPDLYSRLLNLVTRLGCKAALDTSGPALRLAAQERLYALKPNYREALELCGYPVGATPSVVELLSSLAKLDVEHLILTLGGDGAYFFAGSQLVRTIPPQVKVGNTAGAGDSVLATYLAGLELGWSLAERAAKATAAGTAAVQGLGTGLCTPEAAEALLPRVTTQILAY
ncbi:MAG: 1-phosphofructokinase family hexose kinase [Limnochordia bacterium]|jgi:1-phosphofructokinase